jgi:hypothetical protein
MHFRLERMETKRREGDKKRKRGEKKHKRKQE